MGSSDDTLKMVFIGSEEMVDFFPERDKFIDPVADKTWRSTNQDVERFIASDTEPKMRAFLKGAPSLFNAGDRLSSPDEFDIEDALAARNVLQCALLARGTSKNEEVSSSKGSLAEYGLVMTKVPDELKDYLRTRATLTEEVAEPLAENDDEQAFIERETGYTGSLDPDAGIIGIGLDVCVPVGGYADFLLRMVEVNKQAAAARDIANHWGAEWCTLSRDGSPRTATEKRATHLRLLCAMGYYEDSEAGIRKALSSLSDFLMTLHMGDMRTIVINGQEIRSIATGIGSIWWSALDTMRIGRLGACEICGKPFIANNERGKRRKYCSEACKQWRKVHPGQTKIKTKPSPPE